MKPDIDKAIIRVFILTAALILVLLLTKCASLQAPPAWEYLDKPFVPYAPTPESTHSGDEELMTITVGEARRALSVAAQFDLLVPYHNEVVGYANEVSTERDVLLNYARDAYERNRFLLFLSGAGIATGAGSLLLLLFGGN